MYSNKPFFGTKNRSKLINGIIRPIIDNLLLFVLLLLLIKIIIVIGFDRNTDGKHSNLNYHQWVFSLLAIGYLVRSVICIGFKNFRSAFILFTSIGIFLFFSFTLNIDRNIEWLNNQYFYSLLIIGLFVLEFSRFDIKEIALILNPAQLFMFSFAFLIVTGATLLELPNATTSPISFVDALFTSTSAICVTGLIVVDTATQFTALGKSIILMLIQIGGIGIMTFTSFFGFFFKAGSSSFSERFVLSDFFSEDNVSEIRKTLAKVILITLIFEAIGAAFLYFNLDKELFDKHWKQGPLLGVSLCFSFL